jgi:hypothetical protein
MQMWVPSINPITLRNLPSFSNAAAISRVSLAVEVKYNNVSVNSSSAHPPGLHSFSLYGPYIGGGAIAKFF